MIDGFWAACILYVYVPAYILRAGPHGLKCPVRPLHLHCPRAGPACSSSTFSTNFAGVLGGLANPRTTLACVLPTGLPGGAFGGFPAITKLYIGPSDLLIVRDRSRCGAHCFKVVYNLRGRPRPSRGYMPPEYMKDGAYGKKTDVYSLGVITMKIIIAGMGKCPDEQLHEFVREKWKERISHKEYKQVQKCIELALGCMNGKPEERPDMKRVIEILGISEDEMNHHPDGIEERCSVINIDSSEVDPLLEQRHGLLQRCTMTADKRNSPPEILERSRTAVTVRTRLQRVTNSGFLSGVPIIWRVSIVLLGFCLLMYLVLAYIVPLYEMSRTISIKVEEASFTRFSLVTSSSLTVLTYNFSVTMGIYNPSMYIPAVTKKPMEVAFFFGGQRFHVVRPGIFYLHTELVSMAPLIGVVKVDTAAVAEYHKEVSTGLFEVEMVVLGQATYDDGFIICNVQATCPFKLRRALPDRTKLELLQEVKCPLHRNCSSY